MSYNEIAIHLLSNTVSLIVIDILLNKMFKTGAPTKYSFSLSRVCLFTCLASISLIATIRELNIMESLPVIFLFIIGYYIFIAPILRKFDWFEDKPKEPEQE